MSITVPVRLYNGAGNAPDAEKFMADYDFLTAIITGSLIQNGGQEYWSGSTTFTNPADGTQLSDGWFLGKSGTVPATADASRETTIINSGVYSFKWNITGAGSSDSLLTLHRDAVTLNLALGNTCAFGMMVLASTSNKVRIRFTDGTSWAYSLYHTGSGLWEKLTAKLLISNTATALTVYIDVTPDFTGAVYFDSGFLYVVPDQITNYGLSQLTYQSSREAISVPTTIGTSFFPGVNNSYDLGSLGQTWRSLYIGTSVVLRETGGGTDAISLKAPAAVTASYSILFPGTAPTANTNFLKVSDYTTGATVWADAFSGSISLIPTSNNLYDLGSTSYSWRTLFLGTSLVIDDATTTNKVTLTVPAALTNTYTMILPLAAPNNNNLVLAVADYTTGQLAWEDPLNPTVESIIPSADNTWDLGTSTGPYRWRNIYLGTGAIMSAASGGGSVTVKGPATSAVNYNILLPAAAPTSNTVGLKVADYTTGQLEWGTVGGGGSGATGSSDYVQYVVGTASAPYTGSFTQFDLPFTFNQNGKNIQVFYNGQQLTLTNDYTETSTSQITTTGPLLSGARIWFRSIAGAAATAMREDYIVGTASGNYTGSATVFALVSSYNPGGNVMMVTLDGDVQTKGASADYLETNSTTVTFNNALVTGQRVSFIWNQTNATAGVNSGTANQLAYYAASGATVSGSSNISTDSSGRILLGSTARSIGGQNTVIQNEGTSSTTVGLSLTRNSASVNCPQINLAKTRSATVGGIDAVQNGDQLGAITFSGADGTDVDTQAAAIRVEVDGTPGSNDLPGRMLFMVTPDGSNSPVECARFSNSGAFAFKGTATNDSASAGYVGEYVASVVGAVNAFGTSTYGDITSISLTAGDWDVVANCRFENNGATWSEALLGISQTSGNSATGLVAGNNLLVTTFGSTSTVITETPITISSYRVSLASTTTIYMKGRFTYTSGTPRVVGARLSARRVR